MSIVSSGLGQPEQGALVAGGLGLSEPVAPGSISAALNGSATITATLTAVSGAIRAAGNRRNRRTYFTPTVANISAAITAGATLSADIEFTANFDDLDIETLLLVGAL